MTFMTGYTINIFTDACEFKTVAIDARSHVEAVFRCVEFYHYAVSEILSVRRRDL